MVLRLASTSSTRWQLIPSGTAVPPCRSSCSSKESGSQLLQYSSGFVRSGECLAELEGGLKAFLGAGHVAVFLLGEAIVVLDDRIVEELLGCLFEQRCSPQIRVLLVVDPAKGIRNTGVLRLLLARGLGVVQLDRFLEGRFSPLDVLGLQPELAHQVLDQGILGLGLKLARNALPGLGGLAFRQVDGRNLGERLDDAGVGSQRLLEIGQRLRILLLGAGDQNQAGQKWTVPPPRVSNSPPHPPFPIRASPSSRSSDVL